MSIEPAAETSPSEGSSGPPPADPADVAFAVQIAREAGALTLKHFRSPNLHVEGKDDGTPVTVADRGAERLLRVTYLATVGFQPLQRNAARALMQKHAVYIYEAGTVAKIGDLVLVPDFFNDRKRHI